MLIKGISFPDDLIRAWREGKLVIFAGAGVSMSPPSDYPDFAGLTEQIAQGQPLKRGEMDFDRFLGRLADNGVKVHQQAHYILKNPKSKPNSLHFSLLRLFPSVATIRLITTNFDMHFSAAARDLFSEGVQTCYGPELPPAREFQGLCYLHGCIDKGTKSMVLTDRDFGHAYVVDGWAARFLQGIFRYFTVLFVGYRHRDPVIYHMARGLPPEISHRYALASDADRSTESEEEWKAQGIRPIFYSKTPDQGHATLADAIAAWPESIPRPTVAHEIKTKEILSGPQTPDPHENDYIREVIRNVETTHFFTDHAKKVEWLLWAEGEGLFKSLFRVGELDEVSMRIARWYANNFAVDHPDQALAVVARQKGPLHPVLWRTIALRLGSRKLPPDPEILKRWLYILLAYDHPYYDHETFEQLFRPCTTPVARQGALMLFRYLTKPIVVLKEHLDFNSFDGTKFGTRPQFEITIRGSEYGMRHVWENIFKPHLADLATEVKQIIAAQFHELHEMLSGIGGIHRDWDILTAGRQAIEEHEQDQFHRRALDVLIDAARDTIEWLAEHEPEDAKALIGDWSSSTLNILRRLSIHAIRITSALSSDQKLRWLLERDWTFNSPLKHEIYQLIKSSYPHCQESAREDFLNSALKRLEDQAEEYEVCELLEWIKGADPNCEKATKAFQKALENCPGFVAQEHPDSKMQMEVTLTEEISPMKKEELLEKEPVKILDYLISFRGEGPVGSGRRALLSAVRSSVETSFEWGAVLATELKKKSLWGSDLWQAVLWGWIASELTDDQLIWVFSLVSDENILRFSDNYVEELLFEKSRSRESPSSYEWLPCAEELVHKLWITQIQKAEADSSGEEDTATSDNWTRIAANQRGGTLVQSLMYMLGERRRQAGRDWTGIPDQYRALIEQVLSTSSRPAQLGRVILAWNILFLMNVDVDWGRQKVLPLLDWSKSQRTAEQCWHGFLGMGRLPRDLWPELLPLYKMTFPYVSTKLGHFGDDFLRQMAELCFVKDVFPLKDGWLHDFLSAIDEGDRARWSFWVGRFLKSSDDELKKNVWNSWIKPYWNDRNSGKPAPLTDREKEEMLNWALELGAFFPETVQMVLQAVMSRIRNAYFFKTFSEKGLCSSFPNEACQLLLNALRQAAKPFFACEDVAALITQLMPFPELRQDLLKSCDEMVRLECPTAHAMRDEIVEN